ncbi:hypothetical protein NN561_008383 [Cricetulus griseus]
MGPSGRRGRRVSDQAAALGDWDRGKRCGRGEWWGGERGQDKARRGAVLRERRSGELPLVAATPPLPGDCLASLHVSRPAPRPTPRLRGLPFPAFSNPPRRSEPLPSADGSGRGRGRRASADRWLAPPGAERAGADRSNCRSRSAHRGGPQRDAVPAARRGGGMSVVGIDLGFLNCYIAVARSGGIETIANEYSDRCTPFHQLSQSTLVFRVNLCEGNSGTCFPVDQSSQRGFSLDDAVGDPHLPTRGRQEDYQLNGVYIVGDYHQLSLLVLHQGGDCVDSCSKNRWPLRWDIPFASSLLLSMGQQSLLLLLLCLWPVLVGKLEQLGSCLPVQGLDELVRYLEEERPFAIEQVTGMLLAKLKETSENALKKPVADCVISVLATTFDPYLGGRNFDEALVDYFCDEFKTKYKINVKENSRALLRLYQECEKLKKLMSANASDLPLNIECFMNDLDVSSKMNRAQFEQLCASLLARVEPPLIAVMDQARNFTIQNVFPQSDGDSSKVKVKVRINIHGIFSVASASVIEKQNLEGDHNDAPMETETSSKNDNKDDVGKMIMQDKLEKERNDAKNAVEEYVYDFRDKLGTVYEKFITPEDMNKLSAILEDTENWLYEEGEDQPKQVYVDKLQELKKYGQPIQMKYVEHEERPKALNDLGKKIQLVLKVIEAHRNKDERYDHLDPAEMEKVEKYISDSMNWLNSKMNAQNKLSLTQDPVVKVSEIVAKSKELDNFCNSIVYKPKPKVEVPEDKAKANNEHNGPMDGQSGTETNPDPAKGSSQHAESGEMDVD